jgi:hypothetical protein
MSSSYGLWISELSHRRGGRRPSHRGGQQGPPPCSSRVATTPGRRQTAPHRVRRSFEVEHHMHTAAHDPPRTYRREVAGSNSAAPTHRDVAGNRAVPSRYSWRTSRDTSALQLPGGRAAALPGGRSWLHRRGPTKGHLPPSDLVDLLVERLLCFVASTALCLQ